KDKSDGYVACPRCGFTFRRRPLCPECGKILPQRKKRRSLLDSCRQGSGLLTEFQATGPAAESIVHHRLWRRCIAIGRNKGWRMRQVVAVLCREARKHPRDCQLDMAIPRTYADLDTYAIDWELEHNH